MMRANRRISWSTFLSASALAALLSACQPVSDAGAQEAEPAAETTYPYIFTAPDDWRSEIVTFPLSFAPELAYEGHGDVRFAPGMFEADADDFWTYTFIWWVPTSTEVTAERLSTDMDAYFTGLAKRITALNERELPEFAASATYRAVPDADALTLIGRIETLDAFATQNPITLNSTVTEIECPQHERKAVLFAFSPQPTDHANWTNLSQIKANFRCDKG